jgi:hypothetical protein
MNNEVKMKPLNEIKNFPVQYREMLASQFGVNSAEAFFEHATRNSQGVQSALKISPAQLTELLKLIEGYLSPKFVKNCQKPVTKHSRGVIVD